MPIAEIVVTSGSGVGRAVTTANRLLAALTAAGHRGHMCCFRDAEELRLWARACSLEFTHLVCVGGDATQSAAATAAARLAVPLVPVPSGFGNVFARTFGHDNRIASVVAQVERGEVRRVDTGMAGQAIFLCHRSYGFLEDVQRAVERNRAQPRSRLRRHLAYYAMASEILRDIPLSSIAVEVDGVPVAEDSALVTVANVETYRGFLTLTPGASPFDGLLDVFILPRTSKGRLLGRLLALLLKLPGRWDGAQLLRGREVSVTVDGRTRHELRIARGVLPLTWPVHREQGLRAALAMAPGRFLARPAGPIRSYGMALPASGAAHPGERMATRKMSPSPTHTT
jgi:diacylglycerol kinase family enzyme